MTEMKWKIDIWSGYVRRARIIFHHLHDEHCTWFALFGSSLFSSFAFMFFYLTYCRMGIWIWCVCVCVNRLQDLLCRRHYTNMNMVTICLWHTNIDIMYLEHTMACTSIRELMNEMELIRIELCSMSPIWRGGFDVVIEKRKKNDFRFVSRQTVTLLYRCGKSESSRNCCVWTVCTAKSTHSFTHSLTQSFALYILRFVSTLNRWMSAESGNIIIHHTRYAVCICVITELPVCGYGRLLSFRI